MAYRRRQPAPPSQNHPGIASSVSSSSSSSSPPPSRSSPPPADVDDSLLYSGPASSRSLAARAIEGSSAHRDSSLSYAYNPNPAACSPSPLKDSKSKPHEYTSMTNLNEPKYGFWGTLARKAKAILDDDGETHQESTGQQMPDPAKGPKLEHHNTCHSHESSQKTEGPQLQKGLGAIASSLNYIGGTIGNAVEEGLTIVENRTADIIQGTRKHIRKKPNNSMAQNQAAKQPQMQSQVQPQTQTDQELQLKASRDVAMAMAAKAKLLLRELKTVKADLAFAKERCAQLEEENKILREHHERGESLEDDDLIRLQLETLLAEKARLAHENSVYARENRFLREIVEYHQLTMQDVVYLDEGTEEVSEVYPSKVPLLSNSHSTLSTPSSLPPKTSLDASLRASVPTMSSIPERQ